MTSSLPLNAFRSRQMSVRHAICGPGTFLRGLMYHLTPHLASVATTVRKIMAMPNGTALGWRVVKYILRVFVD